MNFIPDIDANLLFILPFFYLFYNILFGLSLEIIYDKGIIITKSKDQNL